MWQTTKNTYHLVRAILANLFYRFPWKGMVLIGVTGTDGKTTTSSIIYHVLNAAGKKAALVSTVSAVVDGKPYDIGFHVTTPRIFALRSYLKKARDLGTKYFVLEVTSHALDQKRVFGFPFHIGVLTNVTHEHLDYHKTYENYVATKAKLLKNAKIAVINRDDESYKQVKSLLYDKKIITFGLKSNADVYPHGFPFKTKLAGVFNRYNCLAAVAVLKELGLSDQHIREGLASFNAPIGRQETVYNKEFKIIIDFAHTPNALHSVLQTIKQEGKGNIIHVFGSAGKRDAAKRPLMGKNSAKYADIIILTAEDPRGESVEKIMDEISRDIKNKTVLKIADRQSAINKALELAKKGDTVIITGKGHETSMNFGRGEEHWSDYEAVEKALRLRSG